MAMLSFGAVDVYYIDNSKKEFTASAHADSLPVIWYDDPEGGFRDKFDFRDATGIEARGKTIINSF